MGDDCLIVTLSALGCGTVADSATDAASDNLMDESSLPTAIIGGAIGGGIAALCLIALVVFLVMRSRSKGPTKAAAADGDEMATARESNSMTNMDTYGNLRLVNVNVYSTAGLGGSSPGASGDSVEPPADVHTYQAPPSQAHYTPMDMKK
jgi:hypothetical protein